MDAVLQEHAGFADCPPLDVLRVPGGQGTRVAGAEAAGRLQFAAEYFPSTTRDGDFTLHPKAPGYVRAG